MIHSGSRGRAERAAIGRRLEISHGCQTQKAIDAILADLNDEQRTAAGHGRGPLLIVAGAGTGKTATLAHRVAALIATRR